MKERCGALVFWQGKLFVHNGRLGQWLRQLQKTPLTHPAVGLACSELVEGSNGAFLSTLRSMCMLLRRTGGYISFAAGFVALGSARGIC
jgi:hypothetical protein